jgi:hypothetical protein
MNDKQMDMKRRSAKPLRAASPGSDPISRRQFLKTAGASDHHHPCSVGYGQVSCTQAEMFFAACVTLC